MPEYEKSHDGQHAENIAFDESPREDPDQLEKLEELKQQLTVDTVHGDEANKILVNYSGDVTWTAEEEKKLVRKIDIRLLTILCLTYGLQCKSLPLLQDSSENHSGRCSLTQDPNN